MDRFMMDCFSPTFRSFFWNKNSKKSETFDFLLVGFSQDMIRLEKNKFLGPLTHIAPPIICKRRQFQILLLFQKIANKAWYFMRIVC